MLDFLGRTHILILHLPIGILLLASVLEWANHLKKPDISKNIFVVIYSIGAFSAIMACVSGYFLSSGYTFTEEETSDHFWAGIVTACIAVLALTLNFTKQIKYRRWISLPLAISLAITGHLGGSLTHGEGFLMPDLKASAVDKELVFNLDDIERAEIYSDIVAPILDNKCVSCHGPNKIKGKLRMDSPAELMANGKSGKDLLAVNGELLIRVKLPPSNDKHMPPKNKSQLTEEHEKVIAWWIENGASFDKKFNEAPDYEKMLPIINKIVDESGDPNSDLKNIAASLPEVDVPLPDETAMNNLRKESIVVLPVGDDASFLEVNFVNVDSITSSHVSSLALLKDNIVHLKVSNVNGLNVVESVIASMKNITKLYLDGTDVSDSQMASFSNFPYLDFINLSRTNISNEGISKLKNNPLLVSIYAFETPVSLDALSTGIKVIKGGFTLDALASDSLRLSE